MVKKLFKHEFKALFRTMLPFQIIALAVGLLTRIIYFFENDSTVYRIIAGSSGLMLGLTLTASLFAVIFVGIRRYYKNLFSCEGYLSFTLPVTPRQHIFVKLFSIVAVEIVTILVALASLSIACAGELFIEIIKAIGYLATTFLSFIPTAHFTFYVIEIIVLLLVTLFYQFLLYYTCISIGQLAKKNRILLAIGCYFIYYVFTQIVGTIIVICGTFFVYTDLYQSILTFIETNYFEFVHIVLISMTVLYSLISLIFFIVSNKITTKKLNLE